MKKVKIAVVYFLFIIILSSQFCLTSIYAANDSKIWDGTIASSFDGGSGTSSDPYIIKTASQLALLAKNVNNGNSYKEKYFRLEDNIVLNDTSKWSVWTHVYGPKNKWTQIGYLVSDETNYVSSVLSGVYLSNKETRNFSGTLDGNGHVIRGVYCISDDNRPCGLFGANSGTIKNLGVVESYIKGNIGVGGIVGRNSGTVESCYFEGVADSFEETNSYYTSSLEKSQTVVSKGAGIGGIVGINTKTVVNCYSRAKILGTQCLGGIVGLNQSGSVSTCISISDFQERSVGKIGENGKFSNQAMDAMKDDCGQIVGYAVNSSGKNIKNCYSINDIKNSYGTKIDKNKASDKTSYQGFNFSGVWTVNVLQPSGMPTLLNVFDYYEHEHKETWVTTKQPTCSKSGVEQKRCEICNEYLSEEKQISATGVHTPGEYITQSQSTCHKNGKKVQKCTVCSTILNEQSLDPLEHEAVVSEKAATCVEDGEIKKVCKLCNTLLETEIIPATGHTAGEFEITVVADCKAAGEKQQKCVDCGEVVNTEQIALAQHIMSDWQTVTDSTMFSGGQQMRECTVCGQIEYENIPKDTKSLTVMISCISAVTVVIGVGIVITVIIKKKKI